ncbi:hypothetical protein ILUMI_04863 [Ignelater luminosus]|uniref:Major facilitator superfamily (MFS) profile domain-containing protein n=1 Tax=Ignelater luminosus TaxID=2038154 RepID=A0A8K0GE47_IGNLU|nr:hypothetical protein ILUMI_04863 [Ignelater luminosus]
MWMPETPYYLIKKGKHEQAKKNLQLLRGDENVEEEMKSLCEAVSRQENVEKGKIFDLFTVKSNRRAVIIFIILNLTKKYSGKNPLMFYTATVFEAADGSLSPQVSVMVYILIELVASLASLSIIDRVGRKPIVVVSTIGCALGLAFTGIYFFLKDEMSISMNSFGWLPITALVIFNISYSVGLELIPSIYLGELFPTSVKAIALGMADIFSIINGTVGAKFFQIVKDTQGIYLPFWVFSACCMIGVIFIIKYVPETKNKTLEEIQQYLIRKTASANP